MIATRNKTRAPYRSDNRVRLCVSAIFPALILPMTRGSAGVPLPAERCRIAMIL